MKHNWPLITGCSLLAAMIIALLLLKHPSDHRRDFEKFLTSAMNVDSKRFIKQDKETSYGDHEKEEVDMPEAMALQDFYLTMDPATGEVPVERLVDAWEYSKALSAQKSTTLDPLVQWTNVPSDMGGRMKAVAWDPNDLQHKKVWAAAATGGLWYNNNITSVTSPWNVVDDFWDGLAVSCIEFDPNNTQIMYAGTGEASTAIITYRESCGKGVGIFKSTDGGLTWTLLPSTSGFAFVTDIRVRNEGGSSVIYAGVVSGKYEGVDHQSIPSDGLYRSADGGLTWTQVLPNITGQTVPWAVCDIDISASGRIFIGTQRNLDGNGGATILFSDAGTSGSWAVYNNYYLTIPGNPDYYLPGRVMVACAPSNANVVYAVIAAGYISDWEVYHGRYFLKSVNQGASWTEGNIPPDFNGNTWATIAWHALTIEVDPSDANTVWLGGLDLNRSENAGQSWEKLTDWSQMYAGGGPDYVHADQHNIAYSPWNASEMIFGCDGGVFYTATAQNATPYFMERSKSLSTLQFYSCALSPITGSNDIVGGLQDNGCLWYTGDPIALDDMVSGGDGAYCFYDKDDPNLFISSMYYNQYVVFNAGSILAWVSDYSSGYFVNPADFDYRMNTLYANAGPMFGAGAQDQLLRIEDMGGASMGQFLNLGTGTTVPFTHVKVSPNSTLSNIKVFLGTMSGKLYKVSQAQNTPQVTEIGSPSFPAAAISCVAVGHSDDTLLVTFSNYGVSSVWQTYNGGLSWQTVEGNLPDMPVRWAIYHPQNSSQALLATELGVWSTSNLNSSQVFWSPAIDGLAHVRVDMLQIRDSDKKVVAATHGRGLYLGTYLLDPSASVHQQQRLGPEIQIYPNPANDWISVTIPVLGETLVRIFDLAGNEVLRNYSESKRNVAFPVALTSLKSGTYLIDIQSLSYHNTRKLVVSK